MKRFYKNAIVMKSEFESNYYILLDENPLKTPNGSIVEVSSLYLAEAISEEWLIRTDQATLSSMPLTQLAVTAIDLIKPDINFYANKIAAYGNTDLVCYRASSPDSLVSQQLAVWQPLIDWLSENFSLPLSATTSLSPVSQPLDTLKGLHNIVMKYSVFELAGLGSATMASGSLVIALALCTGHIDVKTAYEASFLDEIWQNEKWGYDEETQTRQKNVHKDLEVASLFIDLYQKS
jgi:chaperone required for assembly of F1-ATPase